MAIHSSTAKRLAKLTGSMAAAAGVVLGIGVTAPAMAADAVAEWASIKPPTAPELKKVTANSKDTALIVMDLQTNSCNAERRPRCLDTIGPVSDLLKRARDKGMPVIHTLTSTGKLEILVKEVAAQPGEPHVQASVDKFFRTDLENILKSKNVTNVILVGTAAEGAVLATATGAAQRGLKVIVPVDGMSSANAYGEQYVAVYLTTSPGTAAATTLTRAAMIEIN